MCSIEKCTHNLNLLQSSILECTWWLEISKLNTLNRQLVTVICWALPCGLDFEPFNCWSSLPVAISVDNIGPWGFITYAVVTCEISTEIISKLFLSFISHVTTSETEIKLFQLLKLFQRHWTCWKIFVSCNKLLKSF